MTQVKLITISADDAGQRLDRWFKRHYPELGHGRLEKLLRKGQVRLDGKRVKAAQRIEEGQVVRVPPLPDNTGAKVATPPRPQVSEHEADELIARILYRDKDVLIINKEAGLAVQGGTGTSRHLDGMLDALTLDAKERPRLVHRLDKDTSGVLVLARTAKAATWLTEAFRVKDVRKLYWAAVIGVPRPREGKINLALAKLPTPKGERVIADAEFGKRAVTVYQVVEQAGQKAAWLALEPWTGRTHQLRVHCVEIGCPVVGDGKYGGAEAFEMGGEISSKLHLHARGVRLVAPGGKIIEAFADLPEHMVKTWRFLGFDMAETSDDPFLPEDV